MKSDTAWPPRFQDTLRTVLAFGVAFTALTVGANQAQSWVLAADSSRVVNRLAELPGFVLLGGLTILALRAENVTFESIGVSRYHARAGIVIAVNVVVVGLALVTGNELSFGLYAQYA